MTESSRVEDEKTKPCRFGLLGVPEDGGWCSEHNAPRRLLEVDYCGNSESPLTLLKAEVLSLRERLAEAEAEGMEQARLNGMGGEREAALMAKLAEAEKARTECWICGGSSTLDGDGDVVCAGCLVKARRRAEAAESHCAELDGWREADKAAIKAQANRIVELQARLSALTAPFDEGEVEEALDVAGTSANWKRAHPIACNEALVLLARALRQTRAALEECRTAKSALWACGCGHTNGANLSNCAACERRPGETR